MGRKSDFTKRIGFTLEKLATVTGYTRQTLHALINGRAKPQARRLHVAVKALKEEIEKEYQQDMQALQARHAERLAAAEELLELLHSAEGVEG